MNLQRLEKQVAIAEARVDRRNLKAPFTGVVVERLKEVGEWVEPGESVMRLICMNTLNVEGFVSTQTVMPALRGQRVIVVCGDSEMQQRVEGKVVFVSPEFDSLNKQVQIRAEINNPELRLLPGQPARMWIAP
jgi:multidrug resistance efflux pump